MLKVVVLGVFTVGAVWSSVVFTDGFRVCGGRLTEWIVFFTLRGRVVFTEVFTIGCCDGYARCRGEVTWRSLFTGVVVTIDTFVLVLFTSELLKGTCFILVRYQ